MKKYDKNEACSVASAEYQKKHFFFSVNLKKNEYIISQLRSNNGSNCKYTYINDIYLPAINKYILIYMFAYMYICMQRTFILKHMHIYILYT